MSELISLHEQLRIIFLYIILGLFSGIYFRIVDTFTFKLKKYKKYIISSFLFLFLLVLLIYFAIFIIRTYFKFFGILFFISGIFLYFIYLDKEFSNTLNKINQILVKYKIKSYLFPSFGFIKYLKKIKKPNAKS